MATQTPSPTPSAPSIDDATKSAGQAVGYLSSHWEGWVTGGVKIIFILVVALVVRAVIRTMISKMVTRMAQAHRENQPALITNLLENAERRKQRSQAMGSVLRSVASFLILGTAALTALSVLGINLAPLLASAGVAGVAIGFGARNLVTDFLSGVFMILEDQYGVGDQIDTGVASGTVLEVGLRVTKLRGDGGEIWYIRNGEVKRIANMSQGWATATVEVPVGYHEDLGRVEELILAAAEEMAKDDPWTEQLWEPVKVLGVDSLGADTVVVKVAAKTMPGKAMPVARELRRRIKTTLDENGIQVGTVSLPAARTEDESAAAAEIAAPSVLADPTSAQSRAATAIAPAASPTPTPTQTESNTRQPGHEDGR
ncbi:mechanosensitive ion channel family protein [Streptacidiphilus sp. N1-10]|uniref:Mechanosensitive ion channel family protein n=1 Tax=Streptacidiphilus jeojiensis TaxID=3229225 RepID=A0ABV6XTS4_9ACTN